MIQNIKVDVVYFMMATDFEFEFNLGGCCHMRLLNGKAKDKKEYLNALARAVSRSQIIISCGPIFGEDGLISITAAAISRSLETVDNKAYGITSEDKINVIKGAIPLVTPEGYFGGCIIESGSQTIVLLTENRMIRKSIMKNLIHPYIEEMSLMRSSGNSAPVSLNNLRNPVETQEEPQKIEETVDEEIADASDAEDITEPEEVSEEEPETDNETKNETGDFELDEPSSEHQPVEELLESHDIEFDFSGDEGQDEKAEETDFSEQKTDDQFIQDDEAYDGGKSGRGINVSILVLTLILLFAVLGLCYFLVFLPMKNGISTSEYIKQLFDTASSVTSV